MELGELAHHVLFQGSLEAKLESPSDALTDLQPGRYVLAQAPEAPAREDRLRLQTRAGAPFREHGLHEPLARGRVLHFFANHELQAVELMALVLLRHPEAPSEFRAELGRILLEEQDHLRGYLGQMHKLGVQIGQLPLSSFFWRTVCDAPTTQDFIARLCLTFEQANLDHCQRFARLFRAHEDTETAALLESVYADEIGHVMHGVKWFDGGDDMYEAWVARLKTPLSPARAKREPMDRAGRLKAGLPPEFIDRLQRHHNSTGRTPRLHRLRLGLEERRRNPDGTLPAALLELEADLAGALMLVAPSDDAVELPRPPSLQLHDSWVQAGLHDVEIRAPDLPSANVDEDEPDLDLLSRAPAIAWRTAPSSSSAEQPLWGPLEDRQGFVARNPQELEEALHTIRSRGHEQALLKAMWSSSGRHRLRWNLDSPDAAVQQFAERQLAQHQAVVAEPLLDRRRDFGVTFKVGAKGLEAKAEVSHLLNDGSGRYLGHWLNHPLAGLASAERRHLGQSRGVVRALQAEAKRIAAALSARGFTGSAGLDAFVYQRQGALHVQPLVEVNARRTFGHFAAAARRRLAPRTAGLLLQLSARMAKQAGGSLADVAERLRAPWVNDGQRWRRGTLMFTDPDAARQAVLLVMVDESPEAIVRRLAEAGVDTAQLEPKALL